MSEARVAKEQQPDAMSNPLGAKTAPAEVKAVSKGASSASAT